MKKLFALVCAALLSGVLHAQDTILKADTAQPFLQLPLQSLQLGGMYSYRVMVYQNQLKAPITTNQVCIIQLASNLTDMAWAVYTNDVVNTTGSWFHVTVGPILYPISSGLIQIYTKPTSHSTTKYPLAYGPLEIINTTGYGAINPAELSLTFNWDYVTSTGTNQPVFIDTLNATGTVWMAQWLGIASNSFDQIGSAAAVQAQLPAIANVATSALTIANAAVPKTNTITVNGNTGTLSSNLTFIVSGGGTITNVNGQTNGTILLTSINYATNSGYAAQAGTSAVATVALSGWPAPVAQTAQVYVAQAGTSQFAVVAGTASNAPWSGLTGTAPKLASVTNADTASKALQLIAGDERTIIEAKFSNGWVTVISGSQSITTNLPLPGVVTNLPLPGVVSNLQMISQSGLPWAITNGTILLYDPSGYWGVPIWGAGQGNFEDSPFRDGIQLDWIQGSGKYIAMIGEGGWRNESGTPVGLYSGYDSYKDENSYVGSGTATLAYYFVTNILSTTTNILSTATNNTVSTNVFQLVKADVNGNVKITGTLTVTNLVGVTASQVGAVATNDTRYLAALTNLPAYAVTQNMASVSLTGTFAVNDPVQPVVQAGNAQFYWYVPTSAAYFGTVANSYPLHFSGSACYFDSPATFGSTVSGITAAQVGADIAGAAAKVQTNLNAIASTQITLVAANVTNASINALVLDATRGNSNLYNIATAIGTTQITMVAAMTGGTNRWNAAVTNSGASINTAGITNGSAFTLPTFNDVTNIALNSQQVVGTLYGVTNADPSIAGWYQLTNIAKTAVGVLTSASGVTNGQYIFSFRLPVSRFNTIVAGQAMVAYHAFYNTGGGRTYAATRAEIYVVNSNGTTITEFDAGNSNVLATSDTQAYECYIPMTNITLTAGQYFAVRVKIASETGAGMIITMPIQNSTQMGITFPLSSGDFATENEIIGSQAQISSNAPLAGAGISLSVSATGTTITATGAAAGAITNGQNNVALGTNLTVGGIAVLTNAASFDASGAALSVSNALISRLTYDEIFIADSMFYSSCVSAMGALSMSGHIFDGFDDQSGINTNASSNVIWAVGSVTINQTLVMANQWTMNDNAANTTITDAMGRQNLTSGVTTATCSVAGKINTAIALSSVNHIAGTDAGMPTGPATYCMWINMTNTDINTTQSTVLGYGTSGVNNQYRGVYILNGNMGMTQWGAVLSGTNVFQRNVWVHAAVAVSGNTWTSYFNGVLDKQGTMTTATVLGGKLKFGADVTGDSNPTRGYIDDVRVYTQALSQAQVQMIYNGGIGTEATAFGLATNLQSKVYATSSYVPNGGILRVLLNDPSSAVTVNTDLTGSISRDGGTNFTTVSFSDQGLLYGATQTNRVWASAQTNFVGGTANSNLVWRLQSQTKQVIVRAVDFSTQQ